MNRFWRIVLVLSLLGNLSIFYVAYKALGYRNHINFYLDKYQNVVADISGRNEYNQDNEAIRSEVRVDNRVLFFGSQVTKKWNLADHFTEYEAINRGVDSQRVAGFLLRFVPDAVELNPQAVVIEISSYNFRPPHTVKEIEDYATSMATLAVANGIEPIFGTVIPPPRGGQYGEGYSILDSLAKFNRWVIKNAENDQWPCADFNKAFADEAGYMREELAVEGIDPNEKGYQLMSQLVTDVLRRLK